jgi:Ca2+-binding RTX toxin-like protein
MKRPATSRLTKLRVETLEARDVPSITLTGTENADRFDVSAGAPRTINVTQYDAMGEVVRSWQNLNDSVHINLLGGDDTIRILENVARGVSANAGTGNDKAEVLDMANGVSDVTYDNYTQIYSPLTFINPDYYGRSYFAPDFEDVNVYGNADGNYFAIRDHSTRGSLGIFLGAGPDRVEMMEVRDATIDRHPEYQFSIVSQPYYWSTYIGADVEDAVIYGNESYYYYYYYSFNNGDDIIRINDKSPSTSLALFLKSGSDTVIMSNISQATVQKHSVYQFTQVDVPGRFSTYIGTDVDDLVLNGTGNSDTVNISSRSAKTAIGVFLGDNTDSLTINKLTSTGVFQGLNYSRLQEAQEYAYYIGHDNENVTLNGTENNDNISVNPAVVQGFTINGLGGNDMLRGGSGKDVIGGGTGDDVISGGVGDDVLAGNADNDRLYGNDGADSLTDTSGVNLLYGGLNSSLDTLIGAGGKTIYISSNGTPSLPGADQNVSASIAFINGNKSWTEDEITDASLGLFQLAKRTNNTKLLKTSGGTWNSVTFVRDNTNDTDAGAFAYSDNVANINTGTIHIYNPAFTNPTFEPISHTVIHELGHNWDTATENTSTGANSLATFNTLTGFVSAKAQTSPQEDWAETFAAPFTIYYDYISGAAKVAFMEAWFTSMSN